jgi:two-component system, response regulator YesN
MIKLLIVEDEATIREGIFDLIDWRNLGIDVCTPCKDGLEGYNEFLNQKPDILLTDIHMPQMNGIELLKKAKETEWNFEAILLSGYNEFSYAKEGIKLGAYDYLLKPCHPDEIVNTVLKAKDKLEKKIEIERTYTELITTWTKHGTELKWQKLFQWMNQENDQIHNRLAEVEELKIRLKDAPIQIGTIRIQSRSNHPLADLDLGKINFLLTKFLQDYYLSEGLEIFLQQGIIIWCGNIDPTKKQQQLQRSLSRLILHLENHLNVNVCIGLGRIYPNLNSLHLSYSDALECMDNHYYKGQWGLFVSSDNPENNQKEVLEMAQNEERFINAMDQGEYDLAQKELDSWLLLLNNINSKKHIHQLAIFFLQEWNRYLIRKNSMGISWAENLVKEDVMRISNSTTFSEVEQILKQNAKKLFESLYDSKPLHKTIRAAVDIIKLKYNQNITLDVLAKEVFVSTAYLSTLFKQELGVNFLDYLHTFRINKAKQLLKEGLKIYAVAKMTGYQDERHFSTTFKKWTGCSPTEYQKKI